ncbi:Ankyrin repeat domain-containing protein 50 [Phytophthora cinnamomi]|uniref:Ankyrin repeat domain-containing protein 50 n=1 Tax=Phytophthora cinnamomi TaxID=4785 RepID=UPI00355A5036|nr:Ankyrin repeat domain-containing protein 50 [Phytophthora cinnamomi]
MHGGGAATRLDGDVGQQEPPPVATSCVHTLRYTPSARLKIFLSYGHDRFQALAFHLKAQLQRRGHVVWLDIERLSAGIDWEEGIAGGLSWVRDAGQDGRVLLVMTPHALRRPDGYCLNEVARAASLRLNIFPVMVAESAPPPSIAMLPFFDMRDCVPGEAEQAHAKDSPEWRDLMKSCLETQTFLDKAERLYTMLELFDSMTSYGVPAIAGLANLSLFPGFDGAHLDTSRGNSVRRLLSPSLSMSPTREWVRVVVLSREDPPVLSKLHAFDPADVVIDHYQQENDHDIRRYLDLSLSKLPLSEVDFAKASAQIVDGTPDNNHEFGLEQVVELIARRSEGLFLYAVNVVQAITEGRLRLHELAELPVGMGAYLQQFFASHFADHDIYKQRVRPVLEVLCSAYEPLPFATLARVLEWDVYEQRDASAVLGSLFCIEAGYDADSQLLRPFHSSVLDWVQDSNSSGDFFVDAASGHERLGRWAAREYQTLTRSNAFEFVNLNYELETTGDEKLKAKIYIVRNACNHLMQAHGEDCMQLVAAFAADENFQLARRLLHVRAEGLQSFFHGDISRERAQELLTRRQPHRVGSFLIRYTARQRTYCASFVAALDEVTGAPKFRHNLIHHLDNGSYSTVAPAEVTEKTILYPDLISFVEQYQRKGVLTAPVARDAPLNREISNNTDEKLGQ